MTHAPSANLAHHARDIADRAEDAVAKAEPQLVLMARIGLFIKGLVYILIGILAINAAFTADNLRPDSHAGAFHTILSQPFGKIALIVVAIGLFAYALWRFLESIFDFDHDGTGWKAIGVRFSRFCSGLAYAAVGAGAIKTLLGLREKDAVRDWTQWGMSQPLGRTLIALAALIVAGRGLQQLHKAFTARFTKHFDIYDMPQWRRKAALIFGRIGLTARALVFLLIALFLLSASLHHDPSRAKGLGGALRAVELSSYGQFTLGALGAGLLAYGAFTLLEAFHRRLKT